MGKIARLAVAPQKPHEKAEQPRRPERAIDRVGGPEFAFLEVVMARQCRT